MSLLTAVKVTATTVGFALKKHSPEILVGTGIVGTVASTVMACRATLKVNDILDEHRDNMDKIHQAQELVELGEISAEEYTAKDIKKDTTVVYTKTIIKLFKKYAPAALIGFLSISCLIGGTAILKRRNAALALAYEGLSKTFEAYRNRVKTRFGEDVEKQIRYNLTTETVETTDANGNTVSKEVEVADISNSEYAVYFAPETTVNYDREDMQCNLMFLRAQQNYANDLLRIYKKLTLLKVLEMLGMEHSIDDKTYKKAMVVGWKWEPDNPVGDNRVLFDIVESNRKNADGKIEPCLIVDFNVDGNIYNRM